MLNNSLTYLKKGDIVWHILYKEFGYVKEYSEKATRFFNTSVKSIQSKSTFIDNRYEFIKIPDNKLLEILYGRS